METAVTSRGTRERQRVETRERLFQAALDEIRHTGVAGAQVDRIVAVAGVARGTFYFHFPTKEDVLLEWERRREGEIVALLKDNPHLTLPLRMALLGVVTFLTALESAPSERRLLLETLAMHVRHMADPNGYPLLNELEKIVEAARDRGEVRADIQPRELSILFLSNVFGFLVGHADPRMRQPDANLLVDVFLTGVELVNSSASGTSRERS
jgi:TetR/AcrR family transcriptional regulator, repressor for uid operon